MALKFSFFRTPKHRVFNYQPLYYDERKEELEERIARAKEEAQRENWEAGNRQKTVESTLKTTDHKQKVAENAQQTTDEPKKANTTIKSENPHYIPGKNIRHNFRKSVYESRRRPGSPLIMRLIVMLSMIGVMVALYYIAQAFGLFFV